MSEKENVMWHLDKLDIEAERVEFESTLPRGFSVDRDIDDDGWEYKDDATRLAFEGWTRARLSSWLRAAAKHEGGLLTEDIDTDKFREMALSWKNGGDVTWENIIDHIIGHMYGEVWAQITFCLSPERGE